MAEKKSASKFTWDDNAYYSIKLARPTEYPKGSGSIISPGSKVTMRGRAAKIIEADIADAKPITVAT